MKKAQVARIGRLILAGGQDWSAGAIDPGRGQDWCTNPGRPILIAAFRPGLNRPGLVATNPGRKPGLNPQSWQVEVACSGHAVLRRDQGPSVEVLSLYRIVLVPPPCGHFPVNPDHFPQLMPSHAEHSPGAHLIFGVFIRAHGCC